MSMRRFYALVLAAWFGLLIVLGSYFAPYYEAGMRYFAYGLKPCDPPKSRIC